MFHTVHTQRPSQSAAHSWRQSRDRTWS